MITRFTLTIDGAEHDVSGDGKADCISNWADVICAYKRSDYGGVVRSFTSKFDFVGDAYDRLLALFLRDGYDAEATLTAYTLENNRSWLKQFSCELDFSTKAIADRVFSVGAVDSTLAAMIKAGKSTKYEMLVGEDVGTCGTFHFDRLPMMESATYGLTYGESDSESGAITVEYEPPTDGSRAIWMGNTADEICVGRTILYKDDQENDASGFMIEACADVEVKLDSLIRIDRRVSSGAGMDLTLVHCNSGGAEKGTYLLARVGGAAPVNVGHYETAADLNAAHPQEGYGADDNGKYYATVGDEQRCYALAYIGYACAWVDSGKTADEAMAREYEATATIAMASGDRLKARGGSSACAFKAQYSSVKFSWTAIGETCDMPAVSPASLATALLGRIAEGKVNPSVSISGYDPRMAKTVIVAAESLRAMPGAKLYSSFGEYADWMSAAFGYVYRIGERRRSALTQPKRLAGYVETAAKAFTDEVYTGATETSRIVFMEAYGKFMYRAENTGELHGSWGGWANYNHPGYGLARTDTPFVIGGRCYYFVASGGGVEMREYAGDPDYASLDFQDVEFLHRSELFPADAAVKEIADAEDVANATASAQIFSTVEIGYDKKDYDQINGRDEWNFGATYSTGCSVSDKTLTLKSKYRCDCYGMEFAAQKRGKDTTDSDSDSDVFFCYCDKPEPGSYSPNRSDYPVTEALSDRVFNGAYSPPECAKANAGYIGMQSDGMALRFASCEGNSGVCIGGVPMSADIPLGSPLMMAETLEFTTDDESLPARMSDLVRVADKGIAYTGYVSEIEMSFAKEKGLKYKLLIKTIEI